MGRSGKDAILSKVVEAVTGSDGSLIEKAVLD